MLLLQDKYIMNISLDIIILVSFSMFWIHNNILCDTLCDHSYIPLHQYKKRQKEKKRKRKIKSREINKKKRKLK